MSRWFRAYADTHRNPKVAKLTDRQFRLWHNLMCVAAENDGIIPPAEDLKLILNTRLDHLLTGVKALIKGGLIDCLEVGYAPHNWDKRQYKSDTSTDRVHKFRAKRNVSETPPDTETDTEKVSVSKDTAPIADPEALFWQDAKAFLKPRIGRDPGSLIGKWLKTHGKETTIAAIAAAQRERAFQPVSYIEGYFKKHGASPSLAGYPVGHSGIPL